MHKVLLIPIVALVFVIVLAIDNDTAQGISPFSELGNLEMEVLDAINNIVTVLNVETARIDSLNSTQLSELAEQNVIQTDIATALAHVDDHHNERVVTDVQISGLDARLFALENQKEEFNIELRPFADNDGALRLTAASIILYSDELCKIDSINTGPNLYIQFGNTTTVRHETDCEPGPRGTLISLISETDEVFNKGDVLVLHGDTTNGFFLVEVYQDKS